VYDRNHGLHYTDFHSRFILSEDGTIITAVDKGFIRFGSNEVRLPSRNFPVVIQGIKTQQGDMINMYSTQKEVRLNFDNNEITFEFAALSFYAPGLTKYEYMLSGLDKQWQQNSNNPSVRYTHLLPGSYLFKVRAIDYTGRRSDNEASIFVTIVPPWWQTWWFRLPALIVIVSGIIYIIKRNIQRIKNRAATRLQIQGLKEKALRAQMNPHFIFNSLNAIQELVITENYAESYEYLSKFSKLMRMVLQASEKNFHLLSTEIEIIRLYIELESLRFRHLFRFRIQLPEHIDAENISFPSLLLQPFVENAIWHGLLQKDGVKELEITFSEKENQLICAISDNGIGREKARLIKQKKLGAHRSESKGIQMARERLQLLKLTGECSGDIHIGDRLDTDGGVAGTLVEITIVFNEKQHYDQDTYHR
ncbi:MAG: histidine kinase, partial [Niabella sp.]